MRGAPAGRGCEGAAGLTELREQAKGNAGVEPGSCDLCFPCSPLYGLTGALGGLGTASLCCSEGD